MIVIAHTPHVATLAINGLAKVFLDGEPVGHCCVLADDEAGYVMLFKVRPSTNGHWIADLDGNRHLQYYGRTGRVEIRPRLSATVPGPRLPETVDRP